MNQPTGRKSSTWQHGARITTLCSRPPKPENSLSTSLPKRKVKHPHTHSHQRGWSRAGHRLPVPGCPHFTRPLLVTQHLHSDPESSTFFSSSSSKNGKKLDSPLRSSGTSIGNCTMADRKAQQRVVKTVQKITPCHR